MKRIDEDEEGEAIQKPERKAHFEKVLQEKIYNLHKSKMRRMKAAASKSTKPLFLSKLEKKRKIKNQKNQSG